MPRPPAAKSITAKKTRQQKPKLDTSAVGLDFNMDSEPKFLSKLHVTPLADGVNWELTDMLRFRDANGVIHEVKKGFITDFASIPDLDRVGLFVQMLGCFLAWLNGKAKNGLWDALAFVLIAFGFFVIVLCRPLNRDDKLDAPAVLHDDGYRRARLGRTSWVMKFYWDWILFQAMRANREPLWKCWLIWFNVAAFGWFAWYHDGNKS